MSVLSPKRAILFVAASLVAFPLFAVNPSPRLAPRMAFDESAGVGVLFGGRGLQDPATALEHATDETWTWNRNHWVQVFPEHVPPARSAHSMVYDSTRGRIIVFGGRKEATVVRVRFGIHGDTWAWQDGDWQDLAPGNAPEARFYTGMAYDRDRDRVVLYGGYHYATDGKTLVPLTDTWEYDGDNWSRVADNGPVLTKPLLVFDAVRHETLMLGTNADAAVQMYRWNPGASRWDAVTPALLPPCVADAQLVYQAHNQRPIVAGGICSGVGVNEEPYEWDGANWVKIVSPKFATTIRKIDAAMTYDTVAKQVVRFGGQNPVSGIHDSFTGTYRNRLWHQATSLANPRARSMPLFRRDPDRELVWMYGGLNEYSSGQFVEYLDELWSYRNGTWTLLRGDSTAPSQCDTPIGGFDTDRNVLVVVCDGLSVYEWDGAVWKSPSNLTTQPTARRFAGGVYDQNMKRFVMFGGYDASGGYRQDTWAWSGTAWTEIKPKNKPDRRAQPVMWYDPLAKKTIVYSGAGARSIDHHAERFKDMWAFDGTNWTEIAEEAAPGIRFAPQISVGPDGKVLMFGGLRATIDADDRITQFYDNDLWIWDGSASRWTEVQTERAPSPRQNGAFDYDPVSGKFVLFGGFAGNMYMSDRWLWDGQNWTVVPDVPSFRRRSTRP